MPAALIVGRPNANMLAQARALTKGGVEVCCLVWRGEPSQIVKCSRFVAQVISARDGDSESIKRIIQAYAKNKKEKPVVFFGGDPDITLINSIWDDIKDCVICATDPVRADFLNNKATQIEQVRKAGIRVPFSRTICCFEDFNNYKEELIYPALCRPISVAENDGIKDKFVVVDDEAQLRKWLFEVYSVGSPKILFQEYIEGPTTNLYIGLASCDSNGDLNSLVTTRKIFEYPAGLMCIGETVEDREFESVVRKSLKSLKVAGVVGVEFKKDFRKGDFVFIEANLRPENILGIALASGNNLMLSAYKLAVGESYFPDQEPRHAVWRDISLVVFSKLKGKGCNFKKKSHCKVIDAYWCWRDPFPAVIWYFVKIWRLLKK